MKKILSIILVLLVVSSITTVSFAASDRSASASAYNVDNLPRRQAEPAVSKRETNSQTIITANSQKVEKMLKQTYSNGIVVVDIAPQTNEYKLFIDLNTPVVYSYDIETKQLDKVDKSLYKVGDDYKIAFDKSLQGILVISKGELVKK